jgi:hypothetical protein
VVTYDQRAADSAWLLSNLTAKNAMARRETQRGNDSYFAVFLCATLADFAFKPFLKKYNFYKL